MLLDQQETIETPRGGNKEGHRDQLRSLHEGRLIGVDHERKIMPKYGSQPIRTTIELEETDPIKLKILSKCFTFAYYLVISEINPTIRNS